MKDTITFRPASESDLADVVALLSDDEWGAKREDPSLPLNTRYLDSFAAIERDENQLLVVAEYAGSVVGCLQISFIPGLSRLGMWRGQIESVRVSAECRGLGVGRSFLEWAVEKCRQRKCGLIQLTTDKSRSDAYGFYESLGFIASHEGMKLGLN